MIYTVEIYQNNERFACVSHSLDDIKNFITKHLDLIYFDTIIERLVKQTKFPNVILFLNANCELLSIEEFINKKCP